VSCATIVHITRLLADKSPIRVSGSPARVVPVAQASLLWSRPLCRDDPGKAVVRTAALEVDVKTLLAALPRGGAFCNEAWPARHRAVLSFILGAGSVAVVHRRMQERAQEKTQRARRIVEDEVDAERKKAEEYYRRLYEGQTSLVNELQEAHRLKSELFSIVSHEFRTPLAAIIGYTALLSRKEDGALTDEQKESHLQTIARQAERLNRLVENLFFTAHQIEPSLDAVASVEDAFTAVRLQIAETYDDVGWETKIAQGLRPRIAQGALGLVLLNLVSNAVKHATPNTDVRVEARNTEGQVAISVTNTGEPIPVKQRERIFEPFVQSDGAARTAEGIGLGLHIVHKLVVAYGGTVAVDSDEHEVTFTIRLPHDPAPPAAQPPLVLTDSDRVA
jgi:signal transduction histidine kinase